MTSLHQKLAGLVQAQEAELFASCESAGDAGCGSGAGSPSTPGGLQGAPRHLKECGQTTSYPGDSQGAGEPANRMPCLQASPSEQSPFGVSVCPLIPLPTASCFPAADLIPQKVPEPLEQENTHGLLNI